MSKKAKRQNKEREDVIVRLDRELEEMQAAKELAEQETTNEEDDLDDDVKDFKEILAQTEPETGVKAWFKRNKKKLLITGAIFVGAIAAVACAAAAANSDGDGVDFGGFDGDSDDTGFSDGLEEQEFEDIYDTTAEEVTEE